MLRKAKNPKKTEVRLCRIAFAGDQSKAAESRLLSLCQNRGKARLLDPIDWEPLEIVRDMLRDPARSNTIGGAPQVVKVYQYMNSATLGVYWPNSKDGTVHFQGRPVLGYEALDSYVLDPDKFQAPQHEQDLENSK